MPTLAEMRRAVIEIRNRKLPDPSVVGNAGSCFKNPTLSTSEYTALTTTIHSAFGGNMVDRLNQRVISLPNDDKKVPAAFLIEMCGLKGTSMGGARASDKHALVITNASGHATSHDVMNLIKLIRQTVYQKTRVVLKPEPELIGFTEEELANYLALE